MVRIRPSAAYLAKSAKNIEAVPFKSFIAKTIERDKKEYPGMTIFEHAVLTGKVAQYLIKSLPKRVQDLFGDSAVLIAASHDIGKLNQYFYSRIQTIIGNEDTPLCKEIISSLNLADNKNLVKSLKFAEHAFNYHPGLSYITVYSLTHFHYLSSVVGRHHGFFKKIILDEPVSDAGGSLWYEERKKLFNELNKIWPLSLKQDINYTKALMWSGLTSVSDWIASSNLFDKFVDDDAKIDAVMKANCLNKPRFINGLTFGRIFKDPLGKELIPNDLQKKLSNVIKQGPGLYVVEAPMGNGKTEAALYACYKAMEKGNAYGLYFALPTRITSNQIFLRVNDFLGKVLDDESNVSQVFLIHGGADMFLSYAGSDASQGKSWYAKGSRKMLAPFAVGTIDQALLGILHVKHAGVRLFSLTGKTVVFDEVHSYDAYTSTLLQKLVSVLLEFKCTVIILSATLTRNSVCKLFGEKKVINNAVYPALFYRSDEESIKVIPLEKGLKKDFVVNVSYDEDEEYKKVIQKALDGQQILWIENTVPKAQKVYKKLLELTVGKDIECALLHSRFIPCHRQQKENYWIDILGKKSQDKRLTKGRILIGTQVLEQSLDIDADYLVTRCAPIDFLLQRIGRLWRFNLLKRAKTAKAELTILNIRLSDAIDADDVVLMGDSVFVYDPYVLARTACRLEKLIHITLPDDIQSLIDDVYEERTESGFMQKLKDYSKDGCRQIGLDGSRQLENCAVSASSMDDAVNDSNLSDDLENVFTRYRKIVSQDILLLQDLPQSNEDQSIDFVLLNGQSIKLSKDILNKKAIEFRKITNLFKENIVSYHNVNFAIKLSYLENLGLSKILPDLIYKNTKNENAESFYQRFLCAVVKNGKLNFLIDENKIEESSLFYTQNFGLYKI
ncbi:CRISPR-associated helicase Cas3' [Succinatimonas hippei]|uniref:CRISPR-associated helicase Cas3' n=1 Tax=Succinatimonas hippei TaxID=626938 RepID=UPI0026EE0DCA|nr:CRISPR-associated helicase Cas3' [Succinatimonas hippei]